MPPGELVRYLRYHCRLVAVAALVWCGICSGQPLPGSNDPGSLPAYHPRPLTIPLNAGYLTTEGKIRIVGYNDMQNMLSRAAAAFSQLHPGTEFELILKGTRTAPGTLADGTSLLAPMGAEMEEAALASYRKAVGSDPVLFRVAHASLSSKALSGPLVFFVNQVNPLQNISMVDARRILTESATFEPITQWGQLGLEGEWQDLPILPCGVVAGSALATYLQKHHFDQARLLESFRGFDQSAEAVQFGARNPAAFCFASYNRLTDAVKPLAISTEEVQTAMEISEASVRSGVYPLDRHLLIYARLSPCGAIDPVAAEFLRLVLSSVGQSIIATTPERYLPLNPVETQKENLKIDQYLQCDRSLEMIPAETS